MLEVCSLLGITKRNTTAYHPQCNGMVERMNRTLKTMLRKYAAKFGLQWDRYLPGVLWAYRNSPHESTKEKPSFLMFGTDCRSPTEAVLLLSSPIRPVEVCDCREELILSCLHLVSSFWVIGCWLGFPGKKVGDKRNSRPWHGPYRIVEVNDPDVTVVPVYSLKKALSKFIRQEYPYIMRTLLY